MVASATNTAFAGPWGITYSANLTPDTHGLKPWTEEMFVNAIRTGRHFGQPSARAIQPPMPWQQYSQISIEDLKCIYAYLQTVKPVSNVVPDYQPPQSPRRIREYVYRQALGPSFIIGPSKTGAADYVARVPARCNPWSVYSLWKGVKPWRT
jgi:hypothetical protein